MLVTKDIGFLYDWLQRVSNIVIRVLIQFIVVQRIRIALSADHVIEDKTLSEQIVISQNIFFEHCEYIVQIARDSARKQRDDFACVDFNWVQRKCFEIMIYKHSSDLSHFERKDMSAVCVIDFELDTVFVPAGRIVIQWVRIQCEVFAWSLF